MTLLNILKYPDPFLAIKAAPVESVDDGIKTLISDMFETMYQAKGIGLAATQVSANKRVVVLDVPDEEGASPEGAESEYKNKPCPRMFKAGSGKNQIALINPEILSSDGTVKFEEGCLSVPGETAEVERAASIKARARNHKGETIEFTATGLFAIAIQHEIDHLNGILFIDRLSRLKREFMKRRLKKAVEAAVRAL